MSCAGVDFVRYKLKYDVLSGSHPKCCEDVKHSAAYNQYEESTWYYIGYGKWKSSPPGEYPNLPVYQVKFNWF